MNRLEDGKSGRREDTVAIQVSQDGSLSFKCSTKMGKVGCFRMCFGILIGFAVKMDKICKGSMEIKDYS